MASKTGWKKLGPYRAGKKRTAPLPQRLFFDPLTSQFDPITTQRFADGHAGELLMIEHLKKGESKYGN